MMPPAFSSTREAGAFALLLLLILLSPFLVGKPLLGTREQMYLSTGAQEINFPLLHQEIFEEKGDIDIAFMGSSRMACAIDPDYVQKQLSAALGRPAVVRAITWNWNGFDALYFNAKDLLQQRKVRMLVFCDLSPDATNIAHHNTSCWFRWGEDARDLAGMPLATKISFYSSSIIGLPRNLVNLLRHNPPPRPVIQHARNWFVSPFDCTPPKAANPPDVLIYSNATKDAFRFSAEPMAPMQELFMRKIGAMAREHHAELVNLYIPFRADWRSKFITERSFWPNAFGTNVTMVGTPPAVLFPDLSQEQVGKLYFDFQHFNQHGQKYFTPVVTQDLIRIYEDQIKP